MYTQVVSEAKPVLKEYFSPQRIIKTKVLEFLLFKDPQTLLSLNLSLFLSCYTLV